ncbi:MAG: hypothetical protein KDD52_07265 [Bdellovibrionales bacterium]|nr:hypothetical protein [Bdellovibrionales bacterium]
MNRILFHEMEAYFRGKYPELSLDPYSRAFCSQEGTELAHTFAQSYADYGQYLCLRARIYYEHVTTLLKSNSYDAVISLGTGFSLLTFYLSEYHSNIRFIDADDAILMKTRKNRMVPVQKLFGPQTLQVEQKIFDLEKVAKAKGEIQNFFPYKNPLFLMEGLSLFLNKKNLSWLFQSLQDYAKFTFIYDCFSQGSPALQKVRELMNQLSTAKNNDLFFAEGFDGNQIEAMEGKSLKIKEHSFLDLEKKYLQDSSFFQDRIDSFQIHFRVILKN